jgi:hypothetical protein
MKSGRRNFLRVLGATVVGLIAVPFVSKDDYCRNWIRYRHFGPVAICRRTGYVIRCSDEEAIQSLLVESPHFERV